MIEKLEKIIFLLIIFFISSQVGLHFWPESSKVSGIRIDYLSPTLYFLDILIIVWIFVWAGRNIRNFEVRIKNGTLKLFLLLFLLSLVWNILNAGSVGAHIFGIIKLGELGLFGLLVARAFAKDYIRPFVLTLASSAVLSSVLAFWQFIQQSSIGGVWYFFGERTFNASTIGISTVNLNQLILRAYAAFPHPNVLAFFLLTAIALSFMRIPYEGKLVRVFLIVAILLSSIALILTFSRISILIAIALFFYEIYANARVKRYIFGLLAIFLAVIFLARDIFSSEFILRGIDFRQELLAQSFQIFVKFPYFGIGLNNFFVHQTDLIKNISPILFQPPHNIFVIALLSFGIFGWWIFPFAFFLAAKSLNLKLKTKNLELKDFYKSVCFVLISIVIVGTFDHFFLTLEQGQIILTVILGLSFTKVLPDTFKKRKGQSRK